MTGNPSSVYFDALTLTKKHHESGAKTFSGQFTWKQRHRIKEVIDEFEVKSILDYGCGRGKQYDNVDEDGKTLEQYWGIVPTRYDPGVRLYSAEPRGKFDMVICVQVLGSIPRRDIPWVIDRLYGFANKVVFVVERLQIPRKQIYKDIIDEMSFGMGGEEWAKLLAGSKSEHDPVMIGLFKGWSEEQRGWHRVVI